MTRRVLYPIITGGTTGLAWGYLSNRYLGWAGVVLTVAVAVAAAFWALRSLRDMERELRDLQDRLRRGMEAVDEWKRQ
jgi:hypothetical protein